MLSAPEWSSCISLAPSVTGRRRASTGCSQPPSLGPSLDAPAHQTDTNVKHGQATLFNSFILIKFANKVNNINEDFTKSSFS